MVIQIAIDYVPVKPVLNSFPWYVKIEFPEHDKRNRFTSLSEALVWIGDMVKKNKRFKKNIKK